MPEGLQEQFIAKLEEQYGPWEKTTSRFGNATFGKIATDLCISASQFSKLIYGSATEGMYVRSIRNINRIIEANRLRTEKQQLVEQVRQRSGLSKTSIYWMVGLAVLGLILGAGLYATVKSFTKKEIATTQQFGAHPLAMYFDQGFDADFDSPYLKESEVQDFCPCSAYEGRWSLSEEYKLPLPGNRKPGVYYLAKSADVRMKCSKSDTVGVGKGAALLAYEYLINEIWVDTELTPLSPKYFNKENKTYTAEFEALAFEGNPQFKKVATIHSFFIDKFEIRSDSIFRSGEPCGRFATDIDEALVKEYEIDLKHILENVLGDLTKTNCEPTINQYCDPNALQEKQSVITFDCLYTIQAENLGIGGGYPYTKGYQLEEQSYSDNLTCICEE